MLLYRLRVINQTQIIFMLDRDVNYQNIGKEPCINGTRSY
jgi:hypothetical protein